MCSNQRVIHSFSAARHVFEPFRHVFWQGIRKAEDLNEDEKDCDTVEGENHQSWPCHATVANPRQEQTKRQPMKTFSQYEIRCSIGQFLDGHGTQHK